MARKKRSTKSVYDFTNYTPTEEDKKAYESLKASYAPMPVKEETVTEEPVAATVVRSEEEYKPSFLERTITNLLPTEGLRLGASNLLANNALADASTDYNAAMAETLTPKEDVQLGLLEKQLEEVRAGRGTKRGVIMGRSEGSMPTYTYTPYTPEEAVNAEKRLLSRIAELKARIASGEFSDARAESAKEAAAAKTEMDAAQRRADETKAKLTPASERITRNVGQALTLEQALPTLGSLAGGVVGTVTAGGNPLGGVAGAGAGASLGAIPAAKAVYNQSLVQAMLPPEQGGYGATYDEAREYATINTAIEFGSEALGGVLEGGAILGKKLINKLGGKATKAVAAEQLLAKIASRKARTIAAVGTEYITELASTGGQLGYDEMLSRSHEFGTEAGRELMRTNVRKQANEFGDTALDTFIQTLTIGGPAAGIGSHLAYTKEIKERQSAQANKAVRRGLEAMMDRRQTNDIPIVNPSTEPATTAEPIQGELFAGARQSTAAATERDTQEPAVSDSMLNDPVYATKQREILRSVRDTEMERARQLEDQVDEDALLKGTNAYGYEQERRVSQLEASRRMVNSLNEQIGTLEGGAAIQPSLGLNEPTQPKPKAPKPVQTRGGDLVINPDGTVTSTVDEANRAAAKKLLEEEAKADNKAIDNEFKSRVAAHNKARTDYLAGLREQNRGMAPEDRIDALAKAARQWDASNPAPTRDQITLQDALASRQQATKKKGKFIPTATPVQQAATVPVQTSDVGKKVADLANKIGQPMAMEEGGAAASSTFDKAKYIKDTTQLVRGLVKDNSQQAIDILNLDEQGKLAFVPNPKSVGLNMTDNSVAAFDDNGKMYIFTDRINPKDAVAGIIRGYHEATHAGQSNEREGRKPVMETLLGSQKFGDGVSRVVAAAKKGNIVAKKALNATERQLGKDAVDTNPELFKKELMGHFVGEVVRNRNTTLGSVGGVARDILSGAKQTVRSVLGMDVDVSFNDIYSAVKGVGQEIVKTDIERGSGGVPLAMIYNVRDGKPTPGQQRAIEQGYVYDSVDGTRKYVLSDSDATVTDGGFNDLVDTLFTGKPIPIDDVLQHDVLYNERPEAPGELKIAMAEFTDNSIDGMYDSRDKTIYVNKKLANRNRDAIKATILHEAQHYVQQSDGRAENYFRQDPKLKESVEKAKYKFNSRVRQFDNAIATLLDNAPRMTRRTPLEDQVSAIVSDFNATNDARAQKLANILGTDSRTPAGLKKFVDDYYNTKEAYEKAVGEYNKTLVDDYAKYRRNITEREAFFTEYGKNKTQAELDAINPEEQMRKQEATKDGIDITEGKIDIPREDGTTEVRSRTDPLAMEEATTPEQITKRYVPAWVRGLWDSSVGLSRQSNEIIERAMDSPAGERMRAEATMGAYDAALTRLAADRGMTAEELNAQIDKELQAIPQDLEGYDANMAAFDAVVSKYGEAGEALKKMRSQIDALSLTMIENRMQSNIPLSDAEKRLYQTILNNLGRYNNRQYAAYTGKAGKKYAKNVMKDYYKRKKAGDELDEVTEANYKKVANAVKYLVDNSLYIPNADGLGEMDADRAKGLYSTWIGSPTNVPLEQIKQELFDIREKINANKPLLEQRAETISKQLLGLVEAGEPLVEYYRGSKLNTGILKKRSRISPELRELMGEITDPTMTMLMTTAKLSEFTARTKMFLELAKNADGDLLPPGSVVPEGWKPLKGEGYGPLEGYYASPNMTAAIADVQQIHSTFEQAVAMAAHNPTELGKKLIMQASDTWAKAAKVTKAAQIVANPANFLFNLMGGPMIMLQNGNFNPAHVGRAIKDATQLIGYSINQKSANENITKLVENGVVDSAFIGEIKSEQYRELNNLIKNMSGHTDSAATSMFKEYLGKALASGRETYAMMDVIFKIANFHQQEATLRDFYAAEGITKTDEQITREAADDVKRTNFTYRRAMPLAKALEQRGLTAFAPYMSEVFRTQVTNMLQGIGELKRAKEATTPEGKRIMAMRGAKRIAGQMMTYGAVASAASAFGKAAFGDDDEKKEALRSLLPEYLRDQDFLPIGTDENGYNVLIQMSRFDPAGPATDLLRAAINGRDVSAEEVLKKLYDVYVVPRIGGQAIELAKAVVTNKSPSRKSLSQQIAPEFYADMIDIANKFGIDTATVKALTNVGETVLPGFMNSWRDSNNRPTEDDATGAALRAASYIGFTFQTLDPGKPLVFAAKDYKEASDAGKRQLAEFFNDNPDRSAIEVETKLRRLQVNEREAFDQLSNVYKAAQIVGLSKAEAIKAAKKQRLTLQQLRAVSQDKYKSSIVSPSSLQRYMEFELEGAKAADRPEIKRKWKEIERMLVKANKNVSNGDSN